jgi:hypothetical protein
MVRAPNEHDKVTEPAPAWIRKDVEALPVVALTGSFLAERMVVHFREVLERFIRSFPPYE